MHTIRDRIAELVNDVATEELGTNEEPQVEEIIVDENEEIVEDLEEEAVVNEWKQKADELEQHLEHLAWKDFANQADLKVAHKEHKVPGSLLGVIKNVLGFFTEVDANDIREIEGDIHLQGYDTLETLNDVLTHCDFDMLSPATKQLLKTQLGINVRTLKKKMKEDPQAVRKALLNYFFMDESSYAKFVKEQMLVRNFIHRRSNDYTYYSTKAF